MKALLARERVLLVGAALTLGTAAFLVLADAASEGDGPTSVDPHIAHSVVRERSPVATAVARGLTFLGSEPVLAITALVALIVLLERRRLSSAVALAVAMAGSAALTVGAKLAVGRDRPGSALRLGPADRSYSFPSGHTLNSAVLLAMIGVLIVPLLAARTARVVAWAGLSALALGVGLSRVYLGYHWFTDVAGSWLLAAVWVTIVVGCTGRWPRRQSGASQVRSSMIKT